MLTENFSVRSATFVLNLMDPDSQVESAIIRLYIGTKDITSFSCPRNIVDLKNHYRLGIHLHIYI
jgi:hypothetical protein